MMPLRLAAATLLAGVIGLASVPDGAAQVARPACTTAAVATQAGSICGATDTTTVAGVTKVVPVYRGIPYARPPVGSLRWQPTQPATKPDTTIRATAFGLICPQGATLDTSTMSEDCLFLNVWTPPGVAAGSKVPVMVFIHGGAFVMGRGSSPMYNGAYLSAADTVVVVTLNYRLGALGFLYAGTSGGNTVNGNFGLLDQQTAMQWVRRNVGAFGGDTSKVTVFGESAGAMSVGFHLFDMPSSDSLFRAAIMESNPIGVVYRTPSQAQGDGRGYMKKLCEAAGGNIVSCSDLGVRTWFNSHYSTVTTSQVLAAQAAFDAISSAAERIITGGLPQGLPWTPTVDGTVVQGQPMVGYVSRMHRKPYVFGFNRDEGVVFAAAANASLDTTEYNALVDRIWGLHADEVRNYPKGAAVNPYNPRTADSVAGMNRPASALSNLMNDLIFECGNLAAADSGYKANQAAAGKPPIYAYRFERSPVPFMLYDSVAECSTASGMVCHADELPYVFNSLAWADTATAGGTPIQAADTSVSRQMAAAWGAFAKNPFQPPVSGWTAYTRDGSVYPWSGNTNGPILSAMTTTANCTNLWYGLTPLKNGSTLSAAVRAASTASAHRPGDGSRGARPGG